MTMTRKWLLAPAVTALAAALPAHAQSIDYGSLEMLFGEPVTTSATGAPQRSTEAPVTMEIISADEIRASGETSLAGLISRVSGVNEMVAGSRASDVAVRGYNQAMSPRLLVLVNGRQVYQDLYGFTQWDNIPVQLNEIRQIEIVKGPNTALFGFNAVGGVVNIITFNPLYDDTGTVQVRVDDEGGSEGSVVYRFKPSEKVGVRVSAGGFTFSEYDNTTRDQRDGDGNNTRMAYMGELRYQMTPKTQSTLEASFVDTKMFEFYPTGLDSVDSLATTSFRGAVETEDWFGLLKASLYQNDVEFESLTSSTVFEIDAGLTNFLLESLFKVGSTSTVRLAGEYRKSDMTTAATGRVYNVEYSVISGSGMWNWSITDDVSSTLAIRVDQMDYDGDTVVAALLGGDRADGDTTEFSYNAGLVWNASDTDTFRFQVARGVQTPSLIEFWLNPDIEAGYVQNYGVDYDRTLEKIQGGFRASLFHQVNEDMHGVHYQAVMPGLVLPISRQFGESKMTGLELSLDGQVGDSFNWDASFTHLNVDDEILPLPHLGGTLINRPVDYEATTPENELKFNGLYSLGDWEFGGGARYVSDRQGIFSPGPDHFAYQSVDMDAFVALDARAAYRLTDSAVLALEADDITNDGDIQVPGGGMETRYRLSLAVDF